VKLSQNSVKISGKKIDQSVYKLYELIYGEAEIVDP